MNGAEKREDDLADGNDARNDGRFHFELQRSNDLHGEKEAQFVREFAHCANRRRFVLRPFRVMELIELDSAEMNEKAIRKNSQK